MTWNSGGIQLVPRLLALILSALVVAVCSSAAVEPATPVGGAEAPLEAYGGSCEHGELIDQALRRHENHCGSCDSGYSLLAGSCLPSPCLLHTGTGSGANFSCREGSLLASGAACTLQCNAASARPSVPRLNCLHGKLFPQNFTCVHSSARRAEGTCLSAPSDVATLPNPYSGTTVGAGASAAVLPCGESGPQVVLYFDLPSGAWIQFLQKDYSTEVVHRLYWGGPCPGTTMIYCDDFPSGGGGNRITYLAPQTWRNRESHTQRVYFVVSSYGLNTGAFEISFSTQYVRGSDSRSYTLFSTPRKSWAEAVSACISMGYELAVVDDSFESAAILAALSLPGVSSFPWIGSTSLDPAALGWSFAHATDSIGTNCRQYSSGAGNTLDCSSTQSYFCSIGAGEDACWIREQNGLCSTPQAMEFILSDRTGDGLLDVRRCKAAARASASCVDAISYKASTDQCYCDTGACTPENRSDFERWSRCVKPTMAPTISPTSVPTASPTLGGFCENGNLLDVALRTQENQCGSCSLGYQLTRSWSCIPKNCTGGTVLHGAISDEACPDSSDVANGAVCVPTCLAGYTPNISNFSCSLGRFVPSYYKCAPLPCAAPDGIENASNPCSEGSLLASNSSCFTSCDLGFVPDVARLSCYLGQLTPSTFNCIYAACVVPPSFMHSGANASCAEGYIIAPGGLCTSSCTPSYGYSPNVAVHNCSYKGAFTPQEFFCLPRPCKAALDVRNASNGSCAEGLWVASGSACTSTCDPGFRPTFSLLTCMIGDLTPPTFACSPLPCSSPFVGNQSSNASCFEGRVVESGMVCTPACAPGFIANVGKLSCNLGTFLPKSFMCLPGPCTPIDLYDNASNISCREGPSVPSGTICSLRCALGYMSNFLSISCFAGSLFPPTYKCTPIPCRAPSAVKYVDAAINSSCLEGLVVSSGHVCTTSCARGYRRSADELKCFLGLLFPPTYTCTPLPCAAVLGVEHASDVSCLEGSSVMSGSRCSPRCHDGFAPNESLLNCSLGSFVPARFLCLPRTCIAPYVRHGATTSSCSEGPVIPSGSVCTPACEAGHIGSEDNLTCSLGALDPPNFSCVAPDCVAAVDVQNASAVSCVEGPIVESDLSCTTACEPGFEASVAKLSCFVGQFTPPTFACKHASCASPLGVEFAGATSCWEGLRVKRRCVSD